MSRGDVAESGRVRRSDEGSRAPSLASMQNRVIMINNKEYNSTTRNSIPIPRTTSSL